MTKDEALKLALEALEIVNREMLTLRDELAERGGRPSQGYHQLLWDSSHKVYTDTAIPAAEAIREALAQPEQEPVAWSYWQSCLNDDGTQTAPWVHRLSKFQPSESIINKDITPLYTTPPQRKPVAHTTGHCENHKQKGGCQLHNLQCGWPDCDRKPITTPPHRKPLTDVEIWNTYKNLWMFHPAEEPRLAGDVLKFARAIEAAHGIKE